MRCEMRKTNAKYAKEDAKVAMGAAALLRF
jgi:hypothetical protein